MSADRVEALRRIYEGWARGDFQAGIDLLDEHLVWINTPDFIPQRTAWGLPEAGRLLAEFLGEWEEFGIEATAFREAGDSVVVTVRQYGTGKESRAPVELPYFQVWTFRGDRAIRIENFWQESDALRAVGLAGND